jgi:hypothetical protein
LSPQRMEGRTILAGKYFLDELASPNEADKFLDHCDLLK